MRVLTRCSAIEPEYGKTMDKAMPTQEERLAAVEQNLIQFKTETVRAYQDLAMQMTMLKGLTETTIGRLASMQWQIDQRFNTVETALHEHTTLLNEHTGRFDRLETLLSQILARLPEKP
jgi:hypothetical protein